MPDPRGGLLLEDGRHPDIIIWLDRMVAKLAGTIKSGYGLHN